MKRTQIRRRAKPMPRPPRRSAKRMALGAKIFSSQNAHEVARLQRCCQNPNCATPLAPWDAHHPVYAQEVERLGFAKWNANNVLRLCKDCHFRHHHRIHVLPLTMLTQANLDYAFRIMGERAFDYLRRRYSGKDPRLDRMLREAQSVSQPASP